MMAMMAGSDDVVTATIAHAVVSDETDIDVNSPKVKLNGRVKRNIKELFQVKSRVFDEVI